MNSIVRRTAVVGVAVLLVGVVVWPAAAREPAQIQINRGSSALQDGSARIALRARCDANLAAFELDVTVRQGAIIGEVSIVQAGVVTCEEAGIASTSWWHRAPAPSQAGALVFVFLGVFDQSAGGSRGEDLRHRAPVAAGRARKAPKGSR